MPMPHRLRRACALILVLLSSLPIDAQAYIDPNAGGLLYQILFPVIVAVGAAWAGLRHKIGYWWSRLRNRPPTPTDEASDVDRKP
jgi:hypothetical protein